jgi:hypothetical protein
MSTLLISLDFLHALCDTLFSAFASARGLAHSLFLLVRRRAFVYSFLIYARHLGCIYSRPTCRLYLFFPFTYTLQKTHINRLCWFYLQAPTFRPYLHSVHSVTCNYRKYGSILSPNISCFSPPFCFYASYLRGCRLSRVRLNNLAMCHPDRNMVLLHVAVSSCIPTLFFSAAHGRTHSRYCLSLLFFLFFRAWGCSPLST